MGSVYDQTEKEYYHNKRNRCTCRDTGILLPNCGQGQLLPNAVFLSAQLYLYRSVRRLGAFCPPADRAKAGMQVYDGHGSAAYHLDGSPFGKVFYILAAGCRPLPVVCAVDRIPDDYRITHLDSQRIDTTICSVSKLLCL